MANHPILDDEEITGIALPDQMPNPPELPTDPESLHSGTVETLIIQNDDLTARLAVSHRRNAELERRVSEIKCKYSELQNRVEVLSDQILVYREKNRMTSQRDSALEKTIEQLNSQLELQNMRYAELFNGSQSNQAELCAENIELKKSLGRLQRYHSRILRWVNPLLKSQKEQILEQKTSIQDLHHHLGESGEHIKRQKDQLQERKEIYEKELTQLKAQLDEALALKNKYFKLKEERTVHQNRVIAAERARDELLSKHREDTEKLQEMVSKYRSETKTLKLQLQNQDDQQRNLERTTEIVSSEKERLQDQVESLQALWTDAQKKIEDYKNKEGSLQKLNQELSRELREKRISQGQEISKHLEKIKEQQERIRLLETETQVLKKENPLESPQKATVSPEILDQLRSLLTDLQSNTSKKEEIVPTKLKGLSFKESQLISEKGDLEL